MKIVNAYPPMIDEIDRAFHIRGKGVFFAWGDRIYNPAGLEIAPKIMAHEKKHGVRQMHVGVTEWWQRYIEDQKFRLAEEIIGHAAELIELNNTKGWGRNQRRQALGITALRLVNPMYRYMPNVPVFKAKEFLLQEAESQRQYSHTVM